MRSDHRQEDEVEKPRAGNWHRRMERDGTVTERRHHVSREGKNEERYEVGSHRIHILQDAEFPLTEDSDGEWVVWLNTEASDFDGLVLGSGKTRQEAVEESMKVVEQLGEILQGPPPMGRPIGQAEAIAKAIEHGVVSAQISPIDLERPVNRNIAPCIPTKRYIRFMNGEWQEAETINGTWTRVAQQPAFGLAGAEVEP